MFSVIVPVYRNAESIPLLLTEFNRISSSVQSAFGMPIEIVFVIDGSPDSSYEILLDLLPRSAFRSQLILHSRNFGSFAAIRTGLQAATGRLFAAISADLQEPPDLLIAFLENLVDDRCDIVVGTREGRDDPASTRIPAGLFWRFYRRWISSEIPEGGVDLFACNSMVRAELLNLKEAHSSLVGLLFWLGFRRSEVKYRRRRRPHGNSAWTLAKRFTYLTDSVFAFSDLPIRILTFLGLLGVGTAIGLGLLVTLVKMFGNVRVPGYAATILTITFFGGLNTLGIGLIGAYVWRTFENTKMRPLSIVRRHETFAGIAPIAETTSQKTEIET